MEEKRTGQIAMSSFPTKTEQGNKIKNSDVTIRQTSVNSRQSSDIVFFIASSALASFALRLAIFR